MRRCALTALAFLGLAVGQASKLSAQNLVINPSFEANTGCPSFMDEAHLVNDWTSTTGGSPDYFNSCSGTTAGVPTNVFGFSYAREDSAMVGLVCQGALSDQPNYREYLTGRLSEALEAGRDYRIGYYTSTAENFRYAIDGMGMYLADTVIDSLYSSFLGMLADSTFGLAPHVLQTGTAIVDTSGWFPLEWTYTAAGGERNIVIGNFLLQADQTTVEFNPFAFNPYAYYFFDNVFVERIYYSPSAQSDTLFLSLGQDTLFSPLNNDSDYDGFVDAASFAILAGPAHGTASYSPGTGELEYQAEATYIGPDSLQYRVCDDEGLCDTAWIHFRMDGELLGPIALDDAYNLPFGETAWLDILGNDLIGSFPFDPTGPQLIDSLPLSGSLAWMSSEQRIRFVPVPGFCGTVAFAYRICDAEGRCDSAAVELTTACPQTVCIDDAITAIAGTTVALSPLANDLPGSGNWSATGMTLLDGLDGGSAFWQNETVYIDAPDAVGLYPFRYRACGTNGSCDSAWIQLRVEADPDADPSAGLFIPNVVTPNGDGFNDRWVIGQLADHPDHELYIVNRWESTVYESHAYQQNWDGQGLPDGTYFYLLRLRPGTGQETIYRGAISLIR